MADATADSQQSPSTSHPPITQATKLGSSFNRTISSIPILQGPEEYEYWRRRVTIALKILKIEDLIDSSIPRPELTDKKYDIWYEVSMTVRQWLTASISVAIDNKLERLDITTGFADEYFDAITTALLGHGHSRAFNTWYKAVHIKRNQHASMEEFLETYQDMVHLANKLGSPIQPSQATGIVLNEARKVFREYYTSRWNDFISIKPNEVTHDYFLQTCPDLVDCAKAQQKLAIEAGPANQKGKKGKQFKYQLSTSAGTTPSQQDQNDTVSQQAPHTSQQSLQQSTYKQEYPYRKFQRPPRRKVADHIANLKKLTNGDGSCGICSSFTHTAPYCYYVCPERRHATWRPRLDIWCYKAPKSYNSNQSIGGLLQI